MTNIVLNPAAAATADRAEGAKSIARDCDIFDHTFDLIAFQSAYIARRYHLSPCMARLVCHLANIGGQMG